MIESSPEIPPDQRIIEQSALLEAAGYDLTTLGEGVDWYEEPERQPEQPEAIVVPQTTGRIAVRATFLPEGIQMDADEKSRFVLYLPKKGPYLTEDRRRTLEVTRRELTWLVLERAGHMFPVAELREHIEHVLGGPAQTRSIWSVRSWWLHNLVINTYPLVRTEARKGAWANPRLAVEIAKEGI